jgi:hypothetical protein
MTGTVKVRIGRTFYEDDLERPLDNFVRSLKAGMLRAIRGEAIKVLTPKMQSVARAMSAAGNAEFRELGPFITQHLIGIPNTPGSTTTVAFPPVNARYGLLSDVDISPVRGAQLRHTSNRLIWRALSKRYWERKGRKGFFDNTGALRHNLSQALQNAPEQVGPIKVSFDPSKVEPPDLEVISRNKSEILGFFRITYVKKQFIRHIPALIRGKITDIDPTFGLEKLLFDPETVTKLSGDNGRVAQRHMVQPTLAWFLIERIPAAMARAASLKLKS